MDTRHVTDAQLRTLEADARRMRALAVRAFARDFAAWVRGLVSGAAAPKGGRTA